MDYSVHKICRVCLEEGAITSIYSSDFAMMPCTMMAMCAKVRVYKSDGLPAVICNNCIYRLGVAYHFKQECENSDMRLRQYLGLPRGFGLCDAETNTENPTASMEDKSCRFLDNDSEEELQINDSTRKNKRRTRYQRKPQDEHKKRGPKPLPKLPQTCYECSKTFKCSAQLQMHMRVHTGEKPFECNYCPRRFAQKYNLQIHERTHTGERPFQCEICSKQFSALGNFQAHQKIHAGVRDQLCPVCQKAFYTAGDLSKHMQTHTGIKNHQCNVCGKAFSRQRDMQMHSRKMHGHAQQPPERSEEDDEDDNPNDDDDNDDVAVASSVVDEHFKCPDCDKEFSSADSLSIHFRLHGGTNLLTSLPTSLGQVQVPHPHNYHLPPGHHHHPHECLHPHAHHLQINSSPLQPNHQHLHHHHNPSTAAPTVTSAMTHPTMAHILQPPPPPLNSTTIGPTHNSAEVLSIHVQKLHPY